MKRLLAAGFFLLAGSSAGASAQEVANKPTITLDPAKAYVMYTGNKLGQTLTLISIATPQQQDAYRRDRQKALEVAKGQFPQALAAWSEQAARHPESVSKLGPKPVEPTDGNFSFPLPITVVQMGYANHYFARTGDGTVYLSALPPGDYYVADAPYGMFYNVPATCLCLGTVRFHVSAGQITDMGRIVSNYYEAILRARAGAAPKPRNYLDLPEGVTSMAIEPARAGGPVDPRIGDFPVRPAAYHPFGKFPNVANYLVDRLTAMPGVFSYDRDRMVDLTTDRAQ